MRRGLYPLCDVDALAGVGLAPLAFARAVLTAAPPLLQVRAKSWGLPQVRALLERIAPLAGTTTLVVNDHPELADFGMVHVGQDDAPTARLAGARYGRSTHTRQQLVRALAEAPAYVAYGPVFETTSKRDPDACVGLASLADAHALARAAGIPLCAIGGLDETRLALVAPFCDLVAVIGALVHADAREVAERATRFTRILQDAGCS